MDFIRRDRYVKETKDNSMLEGPVLEKSQYPHSFLLFDYNKNCNMSYFI